MKLMHNSRQLQPTCRAGTDRGRGLSTRVRFYLNGHNYNFNQNRARWIKVALTNPESCSSDPLVLADHTKPTLRPSCSWIRLVDRSREALQLPRRRGVWDAKEIINEIRINAKSSDHRKFLSSSVEHQLLVLCALSDSPTQSLTHSLSPQVQTLSWLVVALFLFCISIYYHHVNLCADDDIPRHVQTSHLWCSSFKEHERHGQSSQ